MFRELIDRMDFCSILVVAGVAHAVARAAARYLPQFATAMGWAAAATLLAVCALGYAEVRPALPVEILGVLILAWISAASVAVLTAVLLSPIVAFRDALRRTFGAWRAAAKARAEKERMAAEELQRQRERQERLQRLREEEANRPPPPPPATQAELTEGARHRHEERCRLARVAGLTGYELEAAVEKSQQKYLSELDRIFE